MLIYNKLILIDDITKLNSAPKRCNHYLFRHENKSSF